MKQVVQSARSGRLAVREVPAPKVRDGHILVRTRASLISAGTERWAVDFARKSLAGKAQARPDLVRKVIDKVRRDGIAATWRAVLARLDEPMPLGYAAAGVVEAVGRGLEGVFRVGERVAVAGAGLANHAELNLVPRALAAPVPDGVADEEACFATLGAIALHAARNLGIGLGDVVAVVGAGLVGQIALQLLALGGARVIAIDPDPARLALARDRGAEAVAAPDDAALATSVATLTAGRGCDGVLIAAASDSSAPLATAAAIARDRARISLVGLTGTAFPYREFMQKELSIVVSRSYGPGRYDDDFEGRGVKYPIGFVRWTETENLAEVVRLMTPGRPARLDVKALITHRIPLDQAEAAYDLIATGREPHLGVVLSYAEPAPGAAPPPLRRAKPAERCVLGVIGAGTFARSVLLPELRKLDGIALHTLVARRGAHAEQARAAAGFANAAADEAAVIDDPDINAVVIATRHASHADLAARALAAGKCVFVEKPLALDHAGLERILAARRASAGFFQVGFNRRFAPLTARLKRALDGAPGPRVILIRVNAGAVPTDSWIQADDEGGGRLLGETCHFVDLARHLAGSPIVSVQAAAAAGTGPCEDATIALRCADGSLATVLYTARGDVAAGKERIEAFAGGTVAVLDDFATLSIARGGRTRTHKASLGRDKGFAAELAAFVEAVRRGGPPPIDEAELAETARATLAVLESLQSGNRIEL